MTHYILSIDQGTTNSRAIIFNPSGQTISQHQIGLHQSFPKEGWVEQDPEEMVRNTIKCCKKALKKANIPAQDIVAIGITNQRETTIIWDKKTGKPIYPAIVWQDRRTSDLCKTLLKKNISQLLHEKTGLRLDPYFSLTKILWILDNVPDAREKALRSELLFGTVDTFLLWNLTKQQFHITDVTNASRTMLFNIRALTWDQDILNMFNIPANLLPTVLDNTADFGNLHKKILGAEIPIAGVLGDQQAAAIGQACIHPGMIKATYGTGCFMLLNTGEHFILSDKELITTIAYRIHQETAYALEGSIFSAGTTIKWLRDNLKILKTAAESEDMAKHSVDTGGVYFIPAFTGLGAPYWCPKARAAILGLTRNTNRMHIVRAALESVAYQTRDLIEAMIDIKNIEILRVDGGMTSNHWLLQFIADIINIDVQCHGCIETSALGAAYTAGLQIGLYASLDDIAKLSQFNIKFSPQMPADQREFLYKEWQHMMNKILLIYSEV